MDWQGQLITIYWYVGKHYRQGLLAYGQRMSNYANLTFTDEEVITRYLFGIIDGRTTVTQIYEDTDHHLRDWFPNLLRYEAYVQRLNKIADVFAPLLEVIIGELETQGLGRAWLIDSFWQWFQSQKTQFLKGFVWGQEVYLAGCQLENHDYLIVISDSPAQILADYAQRWRIETWFGILKSRGFRFEQTHLTHSERLNKLIALLAIAFAWSYRTGEYLTHQGPTIPFKKHSNDSLKVFVVMDSITCVG